MDIREARRARENAPRDYNTLKNRYFDLLNEYKYLCYENRRLRKANNKFLKEDYYWSTVKELEDMFLPKK